MSRIGVFMETIANIRQLPELGGDSIHIWVVRLPDVLDRLDVLHGFLSRKEREKAARFHRDADRQSSIAARGALRVLLSVYTGTLAGKIKFNYSESGKPHMDGSDVGFNVSHSNDRVVLAFGRNRSIGVDVEKIRRETDVRLIASRYFALEEQALLDAASDPQTIFFQLWARKEAYVKACGSTLFSEIGSYCVPLDGGELQEEGEKDGWTFRRLDVGPEYAAAVVTDQEAPDVLCYDFGVLGWES